jgi:hypothetical protein
VTNEKHHRPRSGSHGLNASTSKEAHQGVQAEAVQVWILKEPGQSAVRLEHIGKLNDQAAVGLEHRPEPNQALKGLVDMFQDVKHLDLIELDVTWVKSLEQAHMHIDAILYRYGRFGLTGLYTVWLNGALITHGPQSKSTPTAHIQHLVSWLNTASAKRNPSLS